MRKSAHKKVLALLLAVMTVGQSFTLTGFADSGTAKTEVLSGVVSTQDNEVTKSVVIDQSNRDDLIYPDKHMSKQILADGINDKAKDLTAGYSIESSSFDLRNVNGKCYTTPVRSQAPFGTCWSFATIAAIESSILGAGLNGADGNKAKPETLDLSEKQLAWFSARPLNIPNHPQNGEGQYIADFMNSPDSLTTFMNRGGNAVFSEYALMQGIGPSHESSDKQYEYHGENATVVSRWMDGKMQKYSYSDTDSWAISDDLRFNSDYTVKESHNLPKPGSVDSYGYYTYNEEGTKAIKEELLNLRGVQVSFYADASMPGVESDGDYISSNWAHYTYLNTGTNHAVTVVGWDDNYPKENFIEGSFDMMMRDGKKVTIDKQPPANGAWLVKNSWGSGENEFPNKGSGNWGIVENGVHTGYFWLSYYDKSLAVSNPVSYIVEEEDDCIDDIDQHDYMPVAFAHSGKFDQEVKMANRFIAGHNEVLEQVSCYTSEPNTEVTYDIYLLDDFADKPIEGIKVATKNVKYKYSGIHKEDLEDFDILFDVSGDGSNDVIITKYQEYSIVVTQKGEDGKYLMNFPVATNDEGGLNSFKGIINNQESYLLYDDYWNDYKECDDLREEIVEKQIGDQYSTFAKLTYDNFPIKGYTHRLDMDTIFELGGNNYLFYGTKDHSSMTVRFVMHTDSDKTPSFTQSDVIWGMMPCIEEFDGIYVDGEAVSGDPTRYKFTAKKAYEKKTRAYFTVKGIGTVSSKVSVSMMTFMNIDFPFNGIEDQIVFPYTGEEIRPCTGVSSSVIIEPFVEGEDFEFTYTDNIKCGLARVDATSKGDRVPEGTTAFDTFVIVPAKPVIKDVKADGSRIVVEIEDQSESDPSGYRVQYRAKGEENWQEISYSGAGTIFSIFGAEPGKTYEVQVSGYTEVPQDAYWFDDFINYGEASDIKTVDTAAAFDPMIRISGDNRYATAAEIAKASFEKADTVILAYGLNYADALAGVSLAAAMKAPILLTGTTSLPKETTNAIEKLGAKNVIILGGTGVISDEIETTIKNQNIKTERIAGVSRFETAAKIAEKLQTHTGTAPEEIFFVYANSFADALSVSSAAAAKGSPIIYLNSNGELDSATAAYLETVKESVKKAYVIGGSGVISDEMLKAAGDALGTEPVRISGKDRFETCIAVNDTFKDVLSGKSICVATGMDYPDALAGGVYAALNKAPMLLVGGSLTDAQTEYLKSKNADQVIVFGGKGAVSDELANKIADVNKKS